MKYGGLHRILSPQKSRTMKVYWVSPGFRERSTRLPVGLWFGGLRVKGSSICRNFGVNSQCDAPTERISAHEYYSEAGSTTIPTNAKQEQQILTPAYLHARKLKPTNPTLCNPNLRRGRTHPNLAPKSES